MSVGQRFAAHFLMFKGDHFFDWLTEFLRHPRQAHFGSIRQHSEKRRLASIEAIDQNPCAGKRLLGGTASIQLDASCLSIRADIYRDGARFDWRGRAASH